MSDFGWNLESERDLWRAICAPNRWHSPDGTSVATHPESLQYFVRLCYGVDQYFVAHPEQARWYYEPIHDKFLLWLQTHLLRWKELSRMRNRAAEQYYVAAILPRDFGKSVCVTKATAVWTHLDEPDMSTLVCSATAALTSSFLSAIKDLISSKEQANTAWFQWLFGNWIKTGKNWTKENFEHAYRVSGGMSEPSFDTASVDSGMTGYHHRIHIWDDPIIKNKLREGGTYMNGVHDAVNASYNALQKNGLLMFVLTRYLDDDVAGRHFREEGIATWEGMECPNTMMFDKIPMGKGAWHVFFWQTEDELTGEPTHPILWTKSKIAEAKRRDAEDFACQQQNNPGTSDRAPIIESQLPTLYVDYKDFLYDVQLTQSVEHATVHIDTAFKRKETVGKGDDNAIAVWLHDARRNGIMYLDTDNLLASNEWREEEFNDNLIRVLINLRKRGFRVKYLTDEMEPGGKAGSYRNRIMGIVRASGLALGEDQFIQFNRTSDKRARIRTATGNWAEGYVRVLLHKDAAGNWILPNTVRKLFNQILRIDVVSHDDLADAVSDGFAPSIWRPPSTNQQGPGGSVPLQPGDDYIRAYRPDFSPEELREYLDQQREIEENLGPGRGPDSWEDPYDYGSGRTLEY